MDQWCLHTRLDLSVASYRQVLVIRCSLRSAGHLLHHTLGASDERGVTTVP